MRHHFKRRKYDFPKIAAVIIAAVLVSLRVYVLYYPFHVFRYLVPPGDDAVNHLTMIKNVMVGDWKSDYPPLFHALIAFLSNLTLKDPLVILKSVTPLLVIFPSIAVYFFSRKNFGEMTAVFGSLICLWSSNYALVAFGDGNYPNILAAGFFMPLAFLFLVNVTNQKKWTNYLWGIVFAVLIILTHHLSALLFALISLFYIAAVALWNKREKISANIRPLIIFVSVTLGCGIIIIFSTPLRTIFMGAFRSLAQQGSFMANSPFAKPLGYSEYAAAVGNLVWYGGLVSLFYLIYLLGKPEERVNKPAILLILSWFIVTFIFSRSTQMGLPARFARETALPLILSLSVSISSIIGELKFNWQKISGYVLFVFLIAVNLTQVNNGAFRSPDYFNRMIWFSSQEKEISDFIKENIPSEDTVLANQISPYLPIFAQRKIIFLDPKNVTGKLGFRQYMAAQGIKYVLIGKMTKAQPEGSVYPFFKDFAETTGILQQNVPNFIKIGEFSNGSVIYQLSIN